MRGLLGGIATGAIVAVVGFGGLVVLAPPPVPDVPASNAPVPDVPVPGVPGEEGLAADQAPRATDIAPPNADAASPAGLAASGPDVSDPLSRVPQDPATPDGEMHTPAAAGPARGSAPDTQSGPIDRSPVMGAVTGDGQAQMSAQDQSGALTRPDASDPPRVPVMPVMPEADRAAAPDAGSAPALQAEGQTGAQEIPADPDARPADAAPLAADDARVRGGVSTPADPAVPPQDMAAIGDLSGARAVQDQSADTGSVDTGTDPAAFEGHGQRGGERGDAERSVALGLDTPATDAHRDVGPFDPIADGAGRGPDPAITLPTGRAGQAGHVIAPQPASPATGRAPDNRALDQTDAEAGAVDGAGHRGADQPSPARPDQALVLSARSAFGLPPTDRMPVRPGADAAPARRAPSQVFSALPARAPTPDLAQMNAGQRPVASVEVQAPEMMPERDAEALSRPLMPLGQIPVPPPGEAVAPGMPATATGGDIVLLPDGSMVGHAAQDNPDPAGYANLAPVGTPARPGPDVMVIADDGAVRPDPQTLRAAGRRVMVVLDPTAAQAKTTADGLVQAGIGVAILLPPSSASAPDVATALSRWQETMPFANVAVFAPLPAGRAPDRGAVATDGGATDAGEAQMPPQDPAVLRAIAQTGLTLGIAASDTQMIDQARAAGLDVMVVQSAPVPGPDGAGQAQPTGDTVLLPSWRALDRYLADTQKRPAP
ncbi:hypothetical protein ERN12_01525 [Rhodobacteraceae bacterium]|nr:hypothetical protein ERN12_01525 [Paracoccaceae bacterium]